jgi:hypothetical protein
MNFLLRLSMCRTAEDVIEECCRAARRISVPADFDFIAERGVRRIKNLGFDCPENLAHVIKTSLEIAA